MLIRRRLDHGVYELGLNHEPCNEIGTRMLAALEEQLADIDPRRGGALLIHSLVRRGFCADCGTPLTYEAPDGVAVAAGAFDEPERLPPTIQYGVERKLPFVDSLASLPARRTEDDIAALDFLATIVSHQHPDHDTPHWPPRSR